MALRALIAAERADQRRRLGRLLGDLRVDVLTTGGRGRLWQDLQQVDVDLLVVERALLPESAGSLIASVRALPENPEVIVLSAEEDPADRASLLASGCLAVLYNALPDVVLADTLRALISRRLDQVVRERQAAEPARHYTLNDFVSASPAMQTFLGVARRVVMSDSSLLILGETGAGKERLARAIHTEGPRSSGPMVAVNCGALPEGLLESELFGHEQGAFTGATRSRRGYFELADGGTLFLDEIGDLPLHLQVKLLRVLEDRGVQRVGSERAIPVSVRVMAATNRSLESEVEAKRFRADLYYRLAVVTLTVPPLRERREDIPLLVRSYLDHFKALRGHQVSGVSPQAMEALVRYPWPGNVRELINVIERAVLLCAGSEIALSDLPRAIRGRVRSRGQAPDDSGLSGVSYRRLQELPWRSARKELLAAFERRYLMELLRSTGGRIGEAARRAGLNQRSLYDMMQRLELRKEDFKASAGSDRQ